VSLNSLTLTIKKVFFYYSTFEQSFANSTFKRSYDRASVPQSLAELEALLRTFLTQIKAVRGIDSFFAEEMANRLIDQAWPKVPSKNVAIAAQLLWSSDLELDSYESRRQFYWMINDAIRSDKSPLIDSAAPLIRAINLLCICRGAVASRFPVALFTVALAYQTKSS
jgi:hypothetical protein